MKLTVAHAVLELVTRQLHGLLELIIRLDIGLIPCRVQMVHLSVEGVSEEVPKEDREQSTEGNNE